ncbi:MAG: MarR family transcriptional regulator [Bacteroidia bacterium]|nr:MarR family transcriptional regulator [Bacteroidia bacterium]
MQSTSTPKTNSEQQHRFGRLLGQAARLLSNRVNLAFRHAGYDITIEQWTILADLTQKDGLNQQVFADRNIKNKASITSLINNLEKKGWVSRKADRDDRRSNRIHISKEGWRIHDLLLPILQDTLAQTLDYLPEDELITAMNITESLVKELQSEGEPSTTV